MFPFVVTFGRKSFRSIGELKGQEIHTCPYKGQPAAFDLLPSAAILATALYMSVSGLYKHKKILTFLFFLKYRNTKVCIDNYTKEKRHEPER
jgi:hypothetical protein